MTNETTCPECGSKEALTLEKAIVTLERAEACVARIGKAERKRRMWKRRAEYSEKEVERLQEELTEIKKGLKQFIDVMKSDRQDEQNESSKEARECDGTTTAKE